MSTHKAVLVTGSATGAGRAIAIRFARNGYAVAVNYSRSEPEARATLAEVKKLGVPAILCKATVGDDAQVRAMVEQCRAEFGGVYNALGGCNLLTSRFGWNGTVVPCRQFVIEDDPHGLFVPLWGLLADWAVVRLSQMHRCA